MHKAPALRWQPFIWATCCQAALAANPDLSARNTPASRRTHEAPIWPCSGWGLPCGRCCQNPGALLPHPFTLACDLSVHRRYTLCGTFPERRPESPCPAGVTRHPCFVEPGLSSQPKPRGCLSPLMRSPLYEGWAVGKPNERHPGRAPVASATGSRPVAHRACLRSARAASGARKPRSSCVPR